ncbi:MAG: O-methyltransferase [Cytophagales bacterium]
MDFLPEALNSYIEQHTEAENELLKRINRETYTEVLMPRMLSGQLQGRVLSMLSAMIKPKAILEIGTFTGYSAICMAENLSENGMLTTIDINEELESRVRGYFKSAGIENRINYLIGNALDIISSLDENFDLVFIDADKENYAHYYDLVFEKVNKGGFIIADNVLWSGKVVNYNPQKRDKDLEAILQFNKKVHEDARVANVLFPIRDGLMVLRKL